MSHDELSDLLSSLPRHPASPGFTARTLARATGRRTRGPRLRAAFAFVLTVVIALAGTFAVIRHRHEVRMHELRAEQQQIARELDQLKAISNESDPHVYVGSSGSYDFVVGLKPRPARTPRPVLLDIADDGTS